MSVFKELLRAVVKITRHYFSQLSMTFAIFHEFPDPAGFPHLLESPKSPGKSLWSWKVLDIEV